MRHVCTTLIWGHYRLRTVLISGHYRLRTVLTPTVEYTLGLLRVCPVSQYILVHVSLSL